VILDNWFQEERCAPILEDMRQCCIKWKSESLCCEGIDISKEPTEEPTQQQQKQQEEKKK